MVLAFTIMFSVLALLSFLSFFYKDMIALGVMMLLLNLMMLGVIHGLNMQYFGWFVAVYVVAMTMILRKFQSKSKEVGV